MNDAIRKLAEEIAFTAAINPLVEALDVIADGNTSDLVRWLVSHGLAVDGHESSSALRQRIAEAALSAFKGGEQR